MKVKPRTSCGKVRHSTRGAALSSALHCSRERDVALRVYYCYMCKGWHLTSKVR